MRATTKLGAATIQVNGNPPFFPELAVSRFKPRMSALSVAVAAVTLVSIATSCGDPTAIEAQFETDSARVEVFALNGTAPTLPSAIRTRSISAVRVGNDFAFDVAWDLGPAGEVIAYTPRMVANELAGVRRVGLLLAEGPFEAFTKAPASGFKYDSLLVVPTGKLLLVDVIEPACINTSILGPNVRSKVQVDSVNLTRRAIYLRVLSNPNCGFRDLTPGLPKE
jgi:hypothetical protein